MPGHPSSRLAAALAAAAAVALPFLLLDARAPLRTTPPELRWTTGHAATDALAPRIVETLAANRREITGQTGRVRGFGAGASYPQLWIRDSTTLLPVARYTEPRERLFTWLVEHLAHQGRDGRLYDWIAQGEPKTFAADAPLVRDLRKGPLAMSGDRNTAELDQESSAALAASQLYAITGDASWLQRDLEGIAVVERLEHAMAYLAAHRDRGTGLLVGPLTADWGDVTTRYGDQRAIYDDGQPPRVAALYPNASFVAAARAMVELTRASGRDASAMVWQRLADESQRALDAALWDEAAGHYRMHVAVAGEVPAPRFAMGGNAAAALLGVATPERTCRILAAAEQKRLAGGLSTIAAAIVPPFDAGTFVHPILREPWTYQNGGQWDWFAGRLVTAAFRSGCAEEARAALDRIAERTRRAGGLYEWYDRDDRGRGSARYAGTAAALGQAVVEGLFGVKLRFDAIEVAIRLGARPGRLRLGEPATGSRVDLDWNGRDRLRYVVPHRGTVRVLLAPGQRASAWMDGAPAEAKEYRIGADRYVAVTTRPGAHVLTLER